MRLLSILAALAASLPSLAQEPAAPAEPAAKPLPEIGSPAATALVEQGIQKMLAFGRGTFRTSESRDTAMARNAGVPDNARSIEGGWQQDLVWAESDGERYVRHAGRQVVLVGDDWKLRSNKLGSGNSIPFTVDPDLLFTVLRDLPAEARRVVHVERGEVGGRDVAILTVTFEHELANEFVQTGVVPEIGDTLGGIVVLGGLRGLQIPEPDRDVFLAFHIDPENGDVLRLTAKVYEEGRGFGRLQVVRAGFGGNEQEDKEEEEADAGAKPQWKAGLPMRDPTKNESVLVYRVDFPKLGLASPPDLDDVAKRLLLLR
jgi:hypothetical protein